MSSRWLDKVCGTAYKLESARIVGIAMRSDWGTSKTENWDSKTILVTGGTGSFGWKFAEIMLRQFELRKLIVFSRDEYKQQQMREQGFDDPRLRYFIGDVRDVGRLRRAMKGVDIVVHAAALKQVPACEYNPIEAS